MTRIIVITSGKGGVGKTTITANLGIALAKMGNQVALVDADFELRNLDLLLGLEKRIIYTLFDVLAGECRLEQALVKDKRQPGLALLPAAKKRTKELVTPEQIKPLLNDLAQKYEYILIDSPAGIDAGFQTAIASATEALVIATPEISSVRDANRVITLLQAQKIKPIQLIVNRVRPGMVRDLNMMSPEDVQELLGVSLIGSICEDERVIVSTNHGQPLVLGKNKSPAAIAIDKIAQNLGGKKNNKSLDFDLSNDRILNKDSTIDPTTEFISLYPYF
ncbi:MAG: septum site-determining protein MinD [Pelatocladus maniniholoensis HA4357-MV3]|jgi:septum site-determining protein MinD|uniref:Septum site-determining protein MinD n=1 Tax=Pelatocladus maniniholoensis HA4357-MV3 TaxID=1117104 RepID=A0A9E3H914_9NOST|nr:septum site-determining protein MinD [Pelatocladus maniniholoensis HA4357-MV3]